jgi:hypothetical protein
MFSNFYVPDNPKPASARLYAGHSTTRALHFRPPNLAAQLAAAGILQCQAGWKVLLLGVVTFFSFNNTLPFVLTVEARIANTHLIIFSLY